jgi:membrane-associated phospholipid phosphatase
VGLYRRPMRWAGTRRRERDRRTPAPAEPLSASVVGAELTLLVASAVLLGVAWLAVGEADVPSVERTVFRWVNDWPDWLYRPLWAVMQLGNVVTVGCAAVVALVFRRYRLALGCAFAGGTAYLLAGVIKSAVDRGRPAAVLTSVQLRGAHASGLGFVSGHAAVAVALATVVSLWAPRPIRWLLWATALTVCVARVYVGAHLPLDVVGGAALGAMCGATARLLVGARLHGYRAKVEQPAAPDVQRTQ